MTTEEKILEGGKNGPIWKSGDALNSHIIENINLPEDEKKHMPPKGKPQVEPGANRSFICMDTIRGRYEKNNEGLCR